MPIATPSSMKDTSASRPFSSATRAENLEWLAREHFDILIIGGGITGCAAARDAAMRGYRVALVEKEDFASGTSSRSSRLIHGGLRYLEHRQFGLVRESVVERARLLRNASRIVKPLSFVYPVYRRRYPRYAVLSIGLWLYDLMSIGGRRGRSPPPPPRPPPPLPTPPPPAPAASAPPRWRGRTRWPPLPTPPARAIITTRRPTMRA